MPYIRCGNDTRGSQDRGCHSTSTGYWHYLGIQRKVVLGISNHQNRMHFFHVFKKLKGLSACSRRMTSKSFDDADTSDLSSSDRFSGSRIADLFRLRIR